MPARPRSRAGVVRVVESTGSSAKGWEAAVADAVKKVAAEAPEPIGVEVVRLWADLDGRRRLRTFHAAVKVAHRQSLRMPRAAAS